MTDLLIAFAIGMAAGVWCAGLLFVWPLRRELLALDARVAALNRRLGAWVRREPSDETFAESEIPTTPDRKKSDR